MTTQPARPTLLDVARAAEVSRATASRVLAGVETVRPDLARRVLDAAGALGYRTNTAARALRSGSTGSVALVAPSSELDRGSSPFVGAPLQGASSVIFGRSLQPVLLLDDERDRQPLVGYLSAGHVDAAVVVLQRESLPLFRELAELDLPMVFVGRPTAAMDARLSLVDCDNYGGGRQAARVLLEAGRQRLATIAGPAGYAPSDDRLRGFQDELEDSGIQPALVASGDFSLASGSAAAREIVGRRPDLDGLFAGSDLMALGALRVLHDAGLRVAHDVSVVGFDDTVVAETASPPLTTVRQPLREMGERAAELVLEMLGMPEGPPRREFLPTSVTLRRSV
ncbi:LacI family DNA-binding transcriptional regulator [Isoptericola croceus]|uniref:LacI family DNA-binding transcriptional regulator n=1 Tax=Isoptericola croceus TaxID=3031406 RepID=UPI0023F6F2BF|nr:LacI family DNA-binding transcriptional regulator [Isoptericola croceus]